MEELGARIWWGEAPECFPVFAGRAICPDHATLLGQNARRAVELRWILARRAFRPSYTHLP